GDDHRTHPQLLLLPRRRDGAALLVSAVVVLAAHSRPYLLADGTDADVGIPADVRRAARWFVCARRRRVHRLGAVVGYPLPRTARLLDFVSGRNVRAQPRQHHDVAAAPG